MSICLISVVYFVLEHPLRWNLRKEVVTRINDASRDNVSEALYA